MCDVLFDVAAGDVWVDKEDRKIPVGRPRNDRLKRINLDDLQNL